MSSDRLPAQLYCGHKITSSMLYHLKKLYSRSKFNNQPREKGAHLDRIEKLERLMGKLTLENEFLKKVLQYGLNQSQRKGKSLPGSSISLFARLTNYGWPI